MQDLEWFKNRIGKNIYRDPNNCSCKVCADVGYHGLQISDENHAIYLYDIQGMYQQEGIDLNYRDEL